jgi:hypothetical protein
MGAEEDREKDQHQSMERGVGVWGLGSLLEFLELNTEFVVFVGGNANATFGVFTDTFLEEVSLALGGNQRHPGRVQVPLRGIEETGVRRPLCSAT